MCYVSPIGPRAKPEDYLCFTIYYICAVLLWFHWMINICYCVSLWSAIDVIKSMLLLLVRQYARLGNADDWWCTKVYYAKCMKAYSKSQTVKRYHISCIMYDSNIVCLYELSLLQWNNIDLWRSLTSFRIWNCTQSHRRNSHYRPNITTEHRRQTGFTILCHYLPVTVRCLQDSLSVTDSDSHSVDPVWSYFFGLSRDEF